MALMRSRFVPNFICYTYLAMLKMGFKVTEVTEDWGERRVHLRNGRDHWVVIFALNHPELSEIRDATPNPFIDSHVVV